MPIQKPKYKTLAEMMPGEVAVVKSFADDRHILTERLYDLGLTPNSAVSCVMKSPLGDPVAYLIRGAVIAIRKKDAMAVTVAEDFR